MNKYRNKKTVCLLRHLHDSRAEADYCHILLARKQVGEIYDFKIQQEFDLPGGIKHIVDFVVQEKKGGPLEVHEVKGFFTPASRMKMKLFKSQYPDIEYKLIRKPLKKRRLVWMDQSAPKDLRKSHEKKETLVFR